MVPGGHRHVELMGERNCGSLREAIGIIMATSMAQLHMQVMTAVYTTSDTVGEGM